MIDFLLIINIIIPILYSVRKGITRRMVRINHVVCFSFGYIYYWVLPIAFFRYFPNIKDAYYQQIMTMYRTVESRKILFYLFSILFIYFSFILGTSVFAHKYIKKRKILEFNIKFRMEIICMILMLFLLLLVIYKNRSILFTGYMGYSGMERQYTGMFSSILLMICLGGLLHIVYSTKEKFIIGIKSVWFILFIVIAMTLISTGGRLYVASGIIAFICLYAVFYKPIKLSYLIGIAGLGMGLMAIWGYLRVGGSGESGFSILLNSMYYLVAEPIYTSYSLVKYMSTYSIALFRVPISLISAFVNLIPAIVFPNKADYIVTYKKLGYFVDAPLGALNSFTSYNIDFGLFGSVIFIFFLSYYLEKMRKKDKNIWKVVYVMLSSSLVFTFFRDPFSVSIVKYMFEYSFLIPWIFNFVYMKTKKKSISF